jgi:UDP-N-acetylmuramyl pentapeptide phosphotransferase/UDP-N-acetylglucosamine-1-phosphate transferase
VTPTLLVACVLAAGSLTAIARRLATPLGWLDPLPGAPELGRKSQRRPAAPIGGPVVALVGGGCCIGLGDLVVLEGLALSSALLIGVLDDRSVRGLGPLIKLLLQALPASFVAATYRDAGPAAVLLAAFATVFAINVVNTFDNSDGAAGSVSAFGLLFAGSPAGAALLGFLPQNIRRPSGAEPPQAYLGDGGTHLLGTWVVLEPAAWPALVVPAVDLARVIVVRLIAGARPWVGDRRHLAHDLERAGWSTLQRTLAFLACAAPALLSTVIAGAPWRWGGIVLSSAATLALAWRVRAARMD